MNILLLYNSYTTSTNTTFEHVVSFHRFSAHCYLFCHHDWRQDAELDIEGFDAVVIHYSIRLAFDELGENAARELERYPGLKILFIQDEYDHVGRTWHWIRQLGIQLVFTVVPPEGISRVYPPEEFPEVRFVSNLTGYVPDELAGMAVGMPSPERKIIVGYRARPLPVRYGQLGKEKVEVGRLVRQYCRQKGIRHDIDWTERSRIYGAKWYEFMASCRAMLGSESGSNVFDWDGTLESKIMDFRRRHPEADDAAVYEALIAPIEIPGLMNQVSPRIFEAIAARCVLVLFEGTYSGVVQPGVHFIPLKKDGSNLDEVFGLLNDAGYVDAMVERAYQDVIASGKYSYASFMKMVDEQIMQFQHMLLPGSGANSFDRDALLGRKGFSKITAAPVRSKPVSKWKKLLIFLWLMLPMAVRQQIKKVLNKGGA